MIIRTCDICETTHPFCQQATLVLDISEACSKPCPPARDASLSLRQYNLIVCCENLHIRVTYYQLIKRKHGIISTNSAIFISFSNFYTSKTRIIQGLHDDSFISYFTDSVTFTCDAYISYRYEQHAFTD